MNWQALSILFLAVILANLPFLHGSRFLLVFSKRKNFLLESIEFAFLYGIIGLISLQLEARDAVVHNQNWHFYVVTFFLFVVFAFPGFVIKYFWRHRREIV